MLDGKKGVLDLSLVFSFLIRSVLLFNRGNLLTMIKQDQLVYIRTASLDLIRYLTYSLIGRLQTVICLHQTFFSLPRF